MVSKRIERSGFVAEIFMEETTSPAGYRYVVSRSDNPAVLSWGVERTMELAEREANYELANYAARNAD